MGRLFTNKSLIIFALLLSLIKLFFGTTTLMNATTPSVQRDDFIIENENHEPHLDKRLILQILRDAGIENLDEESMQQLPTWSDVTSLYGSHPRISGLDQCKKFRNQTDPAERLVGVAGTFNSGTNLLAALLQRNCHIPAKMEKYGPKRTGMFWQVPWGKHMPPKDEQYRQNHRKPGTEGTLTDSVLPAVTIRDPYSWMRSMCRMSYNVKWKHTPQHCPNLVPNQDDKTAFPHETWNKSVPVLVKYKPFDAHHESLAHMWNDYYQAYMSAEYARIIVRMEDLVFFPRQVTESICTCAGGVMNQTKFHYMAETAKGGGGHGPTKERTSLVSAMIKYGNVETRLEGFEDEDLLYARRVLDRELTEFFAYRDPSTM